MLTQDEMILFSIFDLNEIIWENHTNALNVNELQNENLFSIETSKMVCAISTTTEI